MKKNLMILLLASVLISFSSCVTKQTYPEKWDKPISKDSNIEELIIGSFNCKSNNKNDGYNSYLHYSFDINISNNDCDTVNFKKIEANKLTVSILKNHKIISSKELVLNQDYMNQNGLLSLKSKDEFANDIFVGYGTSQKVLMLDTKGNIIVKSAGYAIGTALIVIPFYISDEHYYIFERLKANKTE